MIREVAMLKRAILSLSAMVEEALERSVRAVGSRDVAAANKVIEGDTDVDRMEIEVEEECLKILALHQPVASDLRFIVAVLKMDADLERIGDLAVGISRNAIAIAKLGSSAAPFDPMPMATHVRTMLKLSLDALVNLDPELASRVIAMDKEADAMYRGMYEQSLSADYSTRENIDCIQRHVLIVRHLERVGDHAKNVSEDVIYMAKGEIVRHGAKAAQ
jgi:phosphate transport system protein